MENNSINEIVETALSNLQKVAEVNTIVGKPLVTVDGTTIVLIPLSSPVYKNADWPIFVTVTPLIDAGITTFSTEKSNPVISPLLGCI